jgi:hypothetical protein
MENILSSTYNTDVNLDRDLIHHFSETEYKDESDKIKAKVDFVLNVSVLIDMVHNKGPESTAQELGEMILEQMPAAQKALKDRASERATRLFIIGFTDDEGNIVDDWCRTSAKDVMNAKILHGVNMDDPTVKLIIEKCKEYNKSDSDEDFDDDEDDDFDDDLDEDEDDDFDDDLDEDEDDDFDDDIDEDDDEDDMDDE